MLVFTEVNMKNETFIKVPHTFPNLLMVLVFDPIWAKYFWCFIHSVCLKMALFKHKFNVVFTAFLIWNFKRLISVKFKGSLSNTAYYLQACQCDTIREIFLFLKFSQQKWSIFRTRFWFAILHLLLLYPSHIL